MAHGRLVGPPGLFRYGPRAVAAGLQRGLRGAVHPGPLPEQGVVQRSGWVGAWVDIRRIGQDPCAEQGRLVEQEVMHEFARLPGCGVQLLSALRVVPTDSLLEIRHDDPLSGEQVLQAKTALRWYRFTSGGFKLWWGRALRAHLPAHPGSGVG